MTTYDPDDGRQPAGADDDNETTLRHKEVLQQVVLDLPRGAEGLSQAELRDRLSAAIAEAGLPEQPARWVEATAQDAFEGRTTFLDARFLPDELQPDHNRADQHQGGGGEGPDIGASG